MVIRKKFKFEAAHIVRNCSSERCKFSIHGHSYIVEVFFEGNHLDNGGMIMDFGLMKDNIKDFIDSFDHCYQYWNKESKEFINFIHNNSLRWIEMPISPSAENYSLLFLYVIDQMVKATEFNNGEGKVTVSSVRVHETDTGYAESFQSDLQNIDFTKNLNINSIVLSDQVIMEWKEPENWLKLKKFINNNGSRPVFINGVVDQQVK
jgi:6-pyruvoyltetrahydropterin/6-carboxytetrahydropterin synthase